MMKGGGKAESQRKTGGTKQGGSSPSVVDDIPRDADGTARDGLIKLLLKSTPLEVSELGSASGQQLEVSHQAAGKQVELAQLGNSGKQLTVKMPASPNKPVFVLDKAGGTGGGGGAGRAPGLERLLQLIQLDHPYSKPWRPESSNTLPTKTLFLDKIPRTPSCFFTDEEELIVVDSEPRKSIPAYDPRQARKAMSECSRFIEFANNKISTPEVAGWEESLPKEGWTLAQRTLVTKMMKVLNLDRLSRLAQEGRDNEPVLRRVTIDKSAKRARAVLSSYPIMWDTKLMQWLNALFSSYLPRSYLAAWLDILQTLRGKVPTLIDRLLLPATNPLSEDKIAQKMGEGLSLLMSRPWDPALSLMTRQPFKKLPANPVIIVAPPGPGDPRFMSRRQKLWNNQLGCLGKVIMINVPLPKPATIYKTSVNHYLYQLVSATLAKVRECKGGSMERPVVVVGWGPGAAIAAHVASVEKVAGVVCLGFPSTCLSGIRGDVGDSILDLKSPTLFVVGERSRVCNSDDIEALRERLVGVETGMVIVGAADNNLRISKRKQRLEGVTQSMVDRSIMEEVREFLAGVLDSPSRQAGSATFAVPNNETKLSSGGSVRQPFGGLIGRPSGGGGVIGRAPPTVGGSASGGGPRKVGKGRKRNSSASNEGSAPSSPAGKKSRPVTPGSASGSVGSSPVKQSQVSPGQSGPPPPPKRRRNSSKKSSVSAESTPDKTTGFPVQGLGPSQFPPGLLSISTPLPQATLDPGPDSPPPLPIRVPLSMQSGGLYPPLDKRTVAASSTHTNPPTAALSENTAPPGHLVPGTTPLLAPPGPVVPGPAPMLAPPGQGIPGPAPLLAPPGQVVPGPTPLLTPPGPVVTGPSALLAPARPVVTGPAALLAPHGPGLTGPRLHPVVRLSNPSSIGTAPAAPPPSVIHTTPPIQQRPMPTPIHPTPPHQTSIQQPAPAAAQQPIAASTTTAAVGVVSRSTNQRVIQYAAKSSQKPVVSGGMPLSSEKQLGNNSEKLFIISVPAGEAGKSAFAGSVVLPSPAPRPGSTSLQITPVVGQSTSQPFPAAAGPAAQAAGQPQQEAAHIQAATGQQTGSDTSKSHARSFPVSPGGRVSYRARGGMVTQRGGAPISRVSANARATLAQRGPSGTVGQQRGKAYVRGVSSPGVPCSSIRLGSVGSATRPSSASVRLSSPTTPTMVRLGGVATTLPTSIVRLGSMPIGTAVHTGIKSSQGSSGTSGGNTAAASKPKPATPPTAPAVPLPAPPAASTVVSGSGTTGGKPVSSSDGGGASPKPELEGSGTTKDGKAAAPEAERNDVAQILASLSALK